MNPHKSRETRGSSQKDVSKHIRTTLVRQRRAVLEREGIKIWARTLARDLNDAHGDYSAFCEAILARFTESPSDDDLFRQAMHAPESRWHLKYEATRRIESILLDSLDQLPSGRLTRAAIEAFNGLMTGDAGGVQLMLESGNRTAAIVGTDAPVSAAYILWKVVQHWVLHRLKRCPQCERWFADESKNVTGVRCSTACTNRYWNRARRRAANHKA
jgi:hypothetical protein